MLDSQFAILEGPGPEEADLAVIEITEDPSKFAVRVASLVDKNPWFYSASHSQSIDCCV